MAHWARKFADRIFASSSGAGDNGISVFGSLAAGSPAFSTDPDAIQALSNWLDGWNAALEGQANPALEDMNAICYWLAYQNAYILQSGVPEWEAATAYYIGQIVRQVGSAALYKSSVDNNIGNAVSDPTKWDLYADFIGSTMTFAGANGVRRSMTKAVGTAVGFGGVATSIGSEGFSTSSGTFVDVTNNSSVVLTAQVQTSGRPVKIQMINGNINTVGSGAAGSIQIVRGTSDVVAEFQIADGPSLIPASISATDTIGPGTQVYKLKAAKTSGTSIGLSNVFFEAYELT